VTAVRADYEFAIAFRVPPPPPPRVPPPPCRLERRCGGRHFFHRRRVDRSGARTRSTNDGKPSRQAEKEECAAHECLPGSPRRQRMVFPFSSTCSVGCSSQPHLSKRPILRSTLPHQIIPGTCQDKGSMHPQQDIADEANGEDEAKPCKHCKHRRDRAVPIRRIYWMLYATNFRWANRGDCSHGKFSPSWNDESSEQISTRRVSNHLTNDGKNLPNQGNKVG
jgi:hypothetical protein